MHAMGLGISYLTNILDFQKAWSSISLLVLPSFTQEWMITPLQWNTRDCRPTEDWAWPIADKSRPVEGLTMLSYLQG